MTEPSSICSIEAARRFYAEEVHFLAHASSAALLEAFATVPRERFLGPGPWRIKTLDGEYWTTESDDPRHVYHNALIALDESKELNNGQPSFLAANFDRLGIRSGDHVIHLGCGTGYYTAILAELVGPQGRVTAVEIEEPLAERARIALELWPWVTVLHGDGSTLTLEPSDVIIANAGATHPRPTWLAGLKISAKLLFPLTPAKGLGIMLQITRKNEHSFEARRTSGVGIYPFLGARDPEESSRIVEALKDGQGTDVRSLRFDPHEKEDSCWLHGEGWCFSKCEAVLAD